MDKSSVKKFFIDLFFPRNCFGCQREGSYLCQDCLATLDILENSFCLCQKPMLFPKPGKCKICRNKNLDGLYFAVSYKNPLIKKIIQSFKYDSLVKDLSTPLALLIITHFNLIQKEFDGKNCVLIPVPLYKKKLKSRGFNQSEEIAKEISENTKIPLVFDCLLRIKETLSQMELSREERLENIKSAFSINNAEKIKGKKILLVDDVYTTGSTMEECAKILKYAGAREVWGVAVAREE
jgi:competence protein ComFC